jgi:hypothetical protein
VVTSWANGWGLVLLGLLCPVALVAAVVLGAVAYLAFWGRGRDLDQDDRPGL